MSSAPKPPDPPQGPPPGRNGPLPASERSASPASPASGPGEGDSRGAGPETLPDARRAALLDLMADPAPAIWRAVRAELEPHLERLQAPLRSLIRADDPWRRSRARTLLGTLHDRRSLRRLQRAACAPRLELESALWRLSALAAPGFDARPYRARLDAYAERVREVAAGRPPGNARNIALAEVLGGEIGLRGPDEDYHHPDRIYLHRTLETGRGMPLTLVAIYLATARRAGLRAAPVPLPGHVMLRLTGTSGSVLVDPFHSGAVRTKKDCQEFLRQHGLEPRESWFEEASDEALFARHLLNLARSLGGRGRLATARGLARISRQISSSPRPANR